MYFLRLLSYSKCLFVFRSFHLQNICLSSCKVCQVSAFPFVLSKLLYLYSVHHRIHIGVTHSISYYFHYKYAFVICSTHIVSLSTTHMRWLDAPPHVHFPSYGCNPTLLTHHNQSNTQRLHHLLTLPPHQLITQKPQPTIHTIGPQVLPTLLKVIVVRKIAYFNLMVHSPKRP